MTSRMVLQKPFSAVGKLFARGGRELTALPLLVALVAVLGERAEPLLSALFLFILAGCVGVIVYLGIQTQKYDLRSYGGEKKEGPDVAGAIMLTATAIYLVLGFTRNLWHPGWVVFVIGGILCGIIECLKKS